jgi:hypothetical protein
MQIALVSGGVEPFSFGPDKTLPGTLHHSGNRPAPPSDHTPLARRSAFQQGRKRGRRRNSAAHAGLKIASAKILPSYAQVCQHESWNFAVPLPFLRRSAGDSMNHKGVEYTLTRSQTPGVLAVAISDRATWSGRDRSRHDFGRPAWGPPDGGPRGYSRPLAPSQVCPDTDQIL